MPVKRSCSLLGGRSILSENAIFLYIKKLCQRHTTDLTASAAVLRFIHSDYTPPSGEKAPLPPHRITFGASQGCSLREARQPAQGCGLDQYSQRLFSAWARGSSLKRPGSTAKEEPCCPFSVLEEMKAAFCRCEVPRRKPLFWSLFFFWGISHRLLQLQTTSIRLLPCPSPRTRLLVSIPLTSLHRGRCGRSQGIKQL